MAPATVLAADPEPGFSLRWGWIFLLLTGLLASTILLKFAQIQYLEILDAFQLLLLLILFFRRGLRAHILRVGALLGTLYLAFACAALGLALVALRNPFFVPPHVGLLKQPVWITLSRIAELAIDVGIMLYLIQIFATKPAKLVFTMKVYFWTGVASAVYAILCYPLAVLKIADLGVYGFDHRMRGFYNEGGPYGLYVLSVFVVGIALYQLHLGKRLHLRIAFFVLAVALLGSRSKAAILAFAVLMIIDAVFARGLWKRVAVIAALVVAAVVFSLSVDYTAQLRSYHRAAEAYERLSNTANLNGNFVYGRVAASFLVPRMIAAHPLLGVGWGNYGLVRNDETYRGASVWVLIADDPSLGLLGEAAELGVPLTVFLLFCFLFPFLYLRRRGAPLYFQNLALLQLIVHLFGGQLNLTYPWVVTAFSLGLAYAYPRLSGFARTEAARLPVRNPGAWIQAPRERAT